jgi:hypothetical protein
MDKRKVNGGGAAEDLDERASKRRKLPNVSRLLGCPLEVAIVCERELCCLYIGDVRRVLKRRTEGFMALHHPSRPPHFVQDGKADSQQGPR